MSMEEYFCCECGRQVRHREHGKCMYCGEPLPMHARMSKEDARAVMAQKHARWKESNSGRQWGLPPGRERRVIWHWDGMSDAGATGGGEGGGE